MVVLTKNICVPKDNFLNAISIYLKHPNAINKEVLYSEVICIFQIESELSQAEYDNLFGEIHDNIFSHENSIETVINIFKMKEKFKLLNESDIIEHKNIHYLYMRKFFPKKTDYHEEEFYEICFLDTRRNIVKLYSLFRECKSSLKLAYENKKYDPFVIMKFNKIFVSYESNCLFLEYDDHLGEKAINWINSVFVTKLMKIMLNKTKPKVSSDIIFSSQLNIMNYYKLYEELKSKYAKILVENWSENTDPQKFVYEDIGIATYLLLLWNEGKLPDENSPKQTFYDLGCGNGLLVYIMNSEGHKGIGLDIRKRRIWDKYPENVILKEEAVIPGPNSIYRDAAWLIGNHSDELTAWLPIMARRSGSQCQFFVLPCCPYQLNGNIYQRKNSSLSVYHDFINYVVTISELCGFNTYIDKLRIPSTKRICIIGKSKNLLPDELGSIKEKIDLFIAKESSTAFVIGSHETGKNWINKFKVRNHNEFVQNCTHLPKDIIEEILKSVAINLLKQENILNIDRGNEVHSWNQGGKIALAELARSLPQEQLQYLKNECKGLQTLIKNHHYIFKVSEGVIRFRNNTEMMEISRKIFNNRSTFKWKQKDCWFHSNHPNGCPLSNEMCSYKHG